MYTKMIYDNAIEHTVCIIVFTGIILGMGSANETTLQCNVVSHFTSPFTGWADIQNDPYVYSWNVYFLSYLFFLSNVLALNN